MITVRKATEKREGCRAEAPCTLTQKEGVFSSLEADSRQRGYVLQCHMQKTRIRTLPDMAYTYPFPPKISSSIFGFVDTCATRKQLCTPQLKVDSRSWYQVHWEPELRIKSVMDHTEHQRQRAWLLPLILRVRSVQMHNITQRSDPFQ